MESIRTIMVCPAQSDEVLINPGKGWILYNSTTNEEKGIIVDEKRDPFHCQSAETWQYATCGYIRYHWCDIEPEPQKYDWDWIDIAIEECQKHGKTLSFGVMAANPNARIEYVTPKHVYDSGVTYLKTMVTDVFTGRKMEHYVPDFTDPNYLKRVRIFADALAERYGDHPGIEYIDLRSFGSWGENSYAWLETIYQNILSTGVDGELMFRNWMPYYEAFAGKKNKLVVAYGYGCDQCGEYVLREYFDRAIELGMALRRDGFFHWTNPCVARELDWTKDKVPGIIEFSGGYTLQKNEGVWDTKKFTEAIILSRATYCPLGVYNYDGVDFLRENKEAIDYVTNKLGYHFILKEATFTEGIGKNKDGYISMKWLNDGIASIFIDCFAAIALLDQNDNVVSREWLETVNPREWKPQMDIIGWDKTTCSVAGFRFNNIPEGRYKLAIGLFSDKKRNQPDIKIGNSSKTKEGWYIIYNEEDDFRAVYDFSQFREVEASSQLTELTPPSNVVDMNSSTMWSSDSKEQQWLLIDLGKIQMFGSMGFLWGMNYAKQYRVQASHDGELWRDIYYTSNGKGKNEKIYFSRVTARYIKIILEKSGTLPIPAEENFPQPGVNLLENPGFEEGLREWRLYDTEAAVVKDLSYQGEYCCHVYKMPHPWAGIQQNILQTLEQAGPGQYEYSAWLKTTRATTVGITLVYRGSGDKEPHYLSHNVKVDAGMWTKVQVKGDVKWTGLLELARIRIPEKLDEGVEIFIDDVSLVKIDAISGTALKRLPEEGRYVLKQISIYQS